MSMFAKSSRWEFAIGLRRSPRHRDSEIWDTRRAANGRKWIFIFCLGYSYMNCMACKIHVLVRGQTGSVERYGMARREASTSVILTLKYDHTFKFRAFQLSNCQNLIDLRGVLTICRETYSKSRYLILCLWRNLYIFHSILNVEHKFSCARLLPCGHLV